MDKGRAASGLSAFAGLCMAAAIVIGMEVGGHGMSAGDKPVAAAAWTDMLLSKGGLDQWAAGAADGSLRVSQGTPAKPGARIATVEAGRAGAANAIAAFAMAGAGRRATLRLGPAVEKARVGHSLTWRDREMPWAAVAQAPADPEARGRLEVFRLPDGGVSASFAPDAGSAGAGDVVLWACVARAGGLPALSVGAAPRAKFERMAAAAEAFSEKTGKARWLMALAGLLTLAGVGGLARGESPKLDIAKRVKARRSDDQAGAGGPPVGALP